MKKQYIIAPYGDTIAMYEADDSRLKNYTDTTTGTFERTKSVVGTVNGHEVGIFHGDNGAKYTIFTDHTAKIIEA